MPRRRSRRAAIASVIGDQIGLGDHDAVGDGDLLHRLDMRVERGICIDRVDQRDDAVEPVGLDQRRMSHDRLQHRRRIGEPGGLDDDAAQSCDAAALQPVDQVGERIDEIAAHRAAKAAVGKLDDAVGRLLDQQMVDRHVAKLIDDDGRVGECGIPEQPVEQRRLAGAEKAGQHRDGNGELRQSTLPVMFSF